MSNTALYKLSVIQASGEGGLDLSDYFLLVVELTRQKVLRSTATWLDCFCVVIIVYVCAVDK